MALAGRMIRGLLEIPGLRFFGISDPARFAERVPTVSVRLANSMPLDAATFLATAASSPGTATTIALNFTERLGVKQYGGLLRIGLVHYNTGGEVDRLLAALREFAASRQP